MLALIRADLRLMLQREADVVQTFEQAVAREVVDLESGAQALLVANAAIFEINGELIVRSV